MRCLLLVVLLACSVEAVQFNCKFGRFTPIVVGSRYACDATVIHSGSPALESVSGRHLTGRSNDDVKLLIIREQYLTSVPERIPTFFKNLDALQIGSTPLASISAKDLQPFPRLVYLEMWANNLTSIDGDLLRYNLHLQVVSFLLNRIKHIGHGLVTNLNSLTYLDFLGNICINQDATTRAHVLSLAPRLSVLCPPLDVTATEATTATAATTTTTTAIAISADKCLCDDEIEELRKFNRALGIQVDILQERLIQENAAFAKRLQKVEKKLLELGSMA